MKNTKMIATVKGHDCIGDAFETNVTFTMLPPKERSFYGTGFYMLVELGSDSQYVDVRYEKTTDVEILADRWIKNYFGTNAEEVSKLFPDE